MVETQTDFGGKEDTTLVANMRVVAAAVLLSMITGSTIGGIAVPVTGGTTTGRGWLLRVCRTGDTTHAECVPTHIAMDHTGTANNRMGGQ